MESPKQKAYTPPPLKIISVISIGYGPSIETSLDCPLIVFWRIIALHCDQYLTYLEKENRMKKISTFRNSLFIVLGFGMLGTFLLSACGLAAPESVKALEANTATVAANTPLPIPTETLSASPAPSRIEFSVQNASLEVKVIDVARPHIVDLGISENLGTELNYTPGDGNIFLDLGIKVSNLTGSDIPLKWTDIYLVNKYQDKWYPTWGAYKKSNTLMDPFTVQILEFDQVDSEYDPDAHLYVAKNGYLRVIFRVPQDNLYYFFGITDAPLIEINWRYYQ